MDRVRQFLDEMKQGEFARGNLLGLLNVLIGRRLSRKDGTVLSEGITWRDMAAHLKKARWDKQAVKELGLAPEGLPPRDRLRSQSAQNHGVSRASPQNLERAELPSAAGAATKDDRRLHRRGRRGRRESKRIIQPHATPAIPSVIARLLRSYTDEAISNRRSIETRLLRTPRLGDSS